MVEATTKLELAIVLEANTEWPRRYPIRAVLLVNRERHGSGGVGRSVDEAIQDLFTSSAQLSIEEWEGAINRERL